MWKKTYKNKSYIFLKKCNVDSIRKETYRPTAERRREKREEEEGKGGKREGEREEKRSKENHQTGFILKII